MKEAKDLKPGDACEFIADGKTLVLEPIPYGRLKKVLALVMTAIADISDKKDLGKDDIARVMPTALMDHASKIIPLLFDPKKHPYISEEWMEENLTIPLVSDIIKKAITINGLTDFFGKLGAGNPAQETRPLSEAKTPTTP